MPNTSSMVNETFMIQSNRAVVSAIEGNQRIYPCTEWIRFDQIHENAPCPFTRRSHTRRGEHRGCFILWACTLQVCNFISDTFRVRTVAIQQTDIIRPAVFFIDSHLAKCWFGLTTRNKWNPDNDDIRCNVHFSHVKGFSLTLGEQFKGPW